jgi:hypothetical protein
MNPTAVATRLSVLVLAFVLTALAACPSGPPETCAQAACDSADSYCQLFGSDVSGVPDVASCETYPAACAAEPSCDCLLEGQNEVVTCREVGGGFEVIFPGG